MRKFVVGLILFAVIAAAGYGLWRGYQHLNSITIVFSDANGLVPNAGVWMAGVEIGKVQAIRIAPDGVDVELLLDTSAKSNLTDKALFVIDPGFANGGSPAVVRVKAGQPGGGPLQRNLRIKGVNSFAIWEASELTDKLRDVINAPQLQDGLRQLEKLGQDLQKK